MFLGIYGTLQFIFFSLASLMIQNTSATALHLSLLSANYYTFVIGTLFLGYKVSLCQFRVLKHSTFIFYLLLTGARIVLYILCLDDDRCVHLFN